jgi:hypothetical protein
VNMNDVPRHVGTMSRDITISPPARIEPTGIRVKNVRITALTWESGVPSLNAWSLAPAAAIYRRSGSFENIPPARPVERSQCPAPLPSGLDQAIGSPIREAHATDVGHVRPSCQDDHRQLADSTPHLSEH